MDNELEARLRRLEAEQYKQGDQLGCLLASQERIHQTLLGLSAQMAEDDNGMKLYELLASLTRATARTAAGVEMLLSFSRQADVPHVSRGKAGGHSLP